MVAFKNKRLHQVYGVDPLSNGIVQMSNKKIKIRKKGLKEKLNENPPNEKDKLNSET